MHKVIDMRDYEVRAPLLVEMKFVRIGQGNRQHRRITELTVSAIIEHNRKVIASIAHIEARLHLACQARNRQLERAWIRLGHHISRYHHFPPAFTAMGLQHLQGHINFRPHATSDNAHVTNAPPAQICKKIGLAKNLFSMYKAGETWQMARNYPITPVQFISPPV